MIANSTQLAGHVEMEDHVKVGGVCAFNQFVRLGQYCYIAGDSSVNKDVLPFSIAQGKYAVMRAANQIGMERSGFSKEDVGNVRPLWKKPLSEWCKSVKGHQWMHFSILLENQKGD